MNEFKVGDMVRVRNDIKNVDDDWSDEMVGFKGKDVTISGIDEDEYYIEEIKREDGYFLKEELISLKIMGIFNDKDFKI